MTLALIIAGGVLLLLAAILIPIFTLVRGRGARVRMRIAADLASESALRGPSRAVYRGGTQGHPKVNGNGTIVLTETRLIFRIMIGTDVVVPLTEITGLSGAASFRGAIRGGKVHLIVSTRSGDIGYYVDDNTAWIAAIEHARLGAR